MTRLLNPITLSARFGAVTLAFILGLCSAGASAQSGDPPRNLLPTELPGGQAPAKPTAVHNVRGFLPDLSFELQGPGGKTLTEKDFLGKTVLVFSVTPVAPTSAPRPWRS
jgi:cytochrome oxidase Cu insertion factor (SCO1/SenC/PrrC family)